jgi:branched-chain amino acid transport system permease protein
MDLNGFIQNVLNGLSIGAVYAIFALGYTIVFSILGIINFAHGAVFTLGAYFTYFLLGEVNNGTGILAGFQLPFGLPFALAILLGSLLAGAVGVLIERLAFRPLRARGADPLLALVSSLGVALLIVNLVQYLVGAEILSFPSNVYGDWVEKNPSLRFGGGERPIQIRTVQVVIFVVSMVVLLSLGFIINRTKIGKALRAVAENQTTASLLGISTDRFILFTFFLSGFLGGLAGTLVGTSFSISGPYFGVAYGLKGLAVIVLGGLGEIPGAIAGGLVIGLAEAFVPGEYSAFKEAVAFALLFIILLVRPQGLLGRKLIQKV